MINDISIVKYPYLGYSPNLIEYFLIVGYEKSYINNEILPNLSSDTKNSHELTVINSLISNSSFDMLDNEMIIKLIFPKQPEFTSTNNLQYEPQNSSVIFFLNADTIGINSKIPFHGCALIFHEYFVVNSSKIFIPKAFCIISQYPYFSMFNNLNKDILNNFRKETEIPIEILIYNLVNFIPSPINFSMNVTAFPNREIKSYSSSRNSLSSKEIPNVNKNSISNISVAQLNGYPVLDCNISEIFNIFPISIVIEILIFNFLEFDMLFFSKNLEILNFVMYIIATLNYPCNDSIYSWHILSVSQEELISSDSSQFVGKPWAAMMGVNCSYNNTIDSCNIVQSHFIVDIDNKNFFFKYNESNEDVVKANTLHSHIKKISKDYTVQSFFLSKNIKNLQKELEIISKQVLTGSGSSGIDQNLGSFFDSGDKIKILNKNIQEAFYDFILNILIVFYNNYFLNSSFDKKSSEGQQNSSFFIHYNEDLSKFSKEELIFYNFFKSSNKYNNYILNFIQEFQCINLFKIPLIFSEEFIYLKKNSDEKIFKSRFFEIIDNFYYDINMNCKPVQINFNSFYCHYEAHLKNYIFNEISDSKNALIKAGKFVLKSEETYSYVYDFVDFDNSILFKYLHYLNKLDYSTREEIFPSLSLLGQSKIKNVKFGDIINSIEKNLFSHKILKSENLIIFSLVLIFIITRSICNFNESISHLRDILELLDSKSLFLRKYINLILSIYNYEHDQSQNNHCVNVTKKCAYIKKMCNFIIINFLRNKNILPNEQMMRMFENFTLKKEDEEFDIPDTLLEEEANMNQRDLEKFNLFLQYHFCSHGTKKADYFLKLSENSTFEGDLFLECCNNSEKRTGLVFKFDFCDKRFNSEIFSPLKLYNASYKLYNDYSTHLMYNKVDRETLDKILINLIFYCKNSNMTYKFLLKFLDY